VNSIGPSCENYQVLLKATGPLVIEVNQSDDIHRMADQGAVQNQGGVSQGEIHAPEPVTPTEQQKSHRSVRSDVLPLLLTLADVCAPLNVSRSTVLRLKKVGGLPGRVTVGGSVRYHRQVIEE
jgi:predicted DNA-binding transcriptional regulator AlpA